MQHQVKHEAHMLSKLIVEEGAYIYVSGRSKNMPKSVEKAFTELLTVGDSALEQLSDAKTYIADMKKQGRYQQEVW